MLPHKDTTTLETPTESSDLDNPITPSPVIFPLPVLQALNTTKLACNFVSSISSAVSNPSALLDATKAKELASPWRSLQ